MSALLGIEKLSHLDWLRADCVVEKFLRLAAWPVRKELASKPLPNP